MSEAVQAAERGNFRPIADLMRDEDSRQQLPPKAWKLIVERMRDRPRKSRRPPPTEQERRAANPVRDAARIVPAIEGLLLMYYPHQSEQQAASSQHGS